MKRKRILIIDVPDVIKTLEAYFERWGYGPAVTTTHVDFIEEMITQHDIGLIIVAQEMTLKGPSLSEQWRRGDDIEADFEFGHEVLQRLQMKNINLPIIFFTTKSLGKSRWVRDNDGKLRVVLIEKRFNDTNVEDLQKAIEEFLGNVPVS